MNQEIFYIILSMLVLLFKTISRINRHKKNIGELLYEYHFVANMNLMFALLIIVLFGIAVKQDIYVGRVSEMMLGVIVVEFTLLLCSTVYVSFNRPSFYEHGIMHYKHHIKWDYIRGYEFRDSRISHKKLLTIRVIGTSPEGKIDLDMDYRLNEERFDEILALLIRKGVGPIDKERPVL